MVDEFDNRIKLPATLVDFVNDVGTTGQDHDSYPEPGQARFDLMRLFLIGLLSNQSSADDNPPTEFRTGTIWFRRTTNAIQIRINDNWVPLANAIELIQDSDSISLSDWFTSVETQLESVVPRHTWSGSSVADGIASITVPNSLQDKIEAIKSSTRPLVYINGLLVDPRNSRFSSGFPVVIELLGGVVVDDGDRYTVVVERFDEFLQDEIVIP